MLKIIILVLSVLCSSYGQITQDGQCDTLPVLGQLTLINVAGTWQEIGRTENPYQSQECSRVALSPNTDPDAPGTITYSGVNNNFMENLSGSLQELDGGHFQFTLPISSNPIDFLISRSDISRYMVGYHCVNRGTTQRDLYVWVLGRQFDTEILTTVNTFLTYDFGISINDLKHIEHTDNKCYELPKIDEGNPIILPGSCDALDLNVVQNFDSSRFAGRWFDVESYYDQSQIGTCNDVSFSLLEESVGIENTQVINQTLNTVTNQATVAADGSGRLNVTATVDGNTVSTELLVLDTDYDTYALLYSCQNQNENEKQIRSWKLSRTRELSNASSTAIDTIISQYYVLNSHFYQANDHSDLACFYYPEPVFGQPVVFRGQCNENIAVVEDFDLDKYLGWWHEIEHYPTDGLVGDCVSSRFETSGNQYLVVDTNIIDLEAVTNTSILQVTNDGKLIKTFANGDTMEIRVLAADYENYALLYSCKNIDSEYSQVWSAKHSKTRQLSEAAQNTINPIIASIPVLDPKYYFQVNQSEDACFHYPEQTGEVVILPGQCDTSIPVVQDFELSQYSGTWYDIERYSRPGQAGTCIGTRYDFNDSNDVDVITWFSSEDGTLNTVKGNVTSESNGRLTVILSVPDSNVTSTTELYVLATDYESYALTYTCANIDEYHRAIGAWKLSRTRTMPSTATNAINAVMNQRQELHQPYFIQVYHDDTCEDPSGAFVLNSSIILLLLCVIVQLFK